MGRYRSLGIPVINNSHLFLYVSQTTDQPAIEFQINDGNNSQKHITSMQFCLGMAAMAAIIAICRMCCKKKVHTQNQSSTHKYNNSSLSFKCQANIAYLQNDILSITQIHDPWLQKWFKLHSGWSYSVNILTPLQNSRQQSAFLVRNQRSVGILRSEWTNLSLNQMTF